MSNDLQRTIIGGAARAGKSYLAAQLCESRSDLFVLTVDALLHVYRKRARIADASAAQECLTEWFNRPRYMNPEQTVTRRPIDDAGVPLSRILEEVRFAGLETAVEVILAGLDAVVRLNGKNGWIVLDLHPETHFPFYKKVCADLNLLVVVRDPVESTAASLYWRRFPVRESRDYKYFVFLWLLAVYTVAKLRRHYPKDIHYVTTSDVCNGTIDLDKGLQFQRLNSPLYFSMVIERDGERKLFYTPEGRVCALLGEGELSYIEAKCRRVFTFVQENKIFLIDTPWWFNWFGLNYSRKLVDMRFDTKNSFRRIYEIYKNRLVSVLRAIK